jgi:hypothetical protein
VLPPFIIEQIRRREESRKHNQQPQLELPIPPPPRKKPIELDDDPERGVIVIDL